MIFEQFVGIDYSGAGKAGSRQRGIQVYTATNSKRPEQVFCKPDSKTAWSRTSLCDWLDDLLHSPQRKIIGIDHGFSFPQSYFQRHGLRTWDAFLRDFVEHWPTDHSAATVEEFRKGNPRSGEDTDMRITDRWAPGAKSVFQFDVQGSVAKSTHAGLPFLYRLRKRYRRRLHFWPFDGWTPALSKSLIGEVFPSLFRKRYPRQNRTVDQQDAFSVCSWFRDMQKMNRLSFYFDPAITDAQRRTARREGWILGVV